MRILISNDDGYLAPGLLALFDAVQGLGEIIVVAPEQNKSGASNSLTLDRPLTVQQASSGAQNGFYFVNGTPTDCVHVALTGLLPKMPDLVLSGINNGQNMGDDTIYSGTVAAAMEGFLFDIPAIAFSQVDKGFKELEGAQRVMRAIVQQAITALEQATLPTPFLWNVNIPNLPYDQLKGTQITRLGKRHASEPVIKSSNPHGAPIYWIGAAGPARDAGEGTDFYATANHYVSLTPLKSDLTDTQALHAMPVFLEPQTKRN